MFIFYTAVALCNEVNTCHPDADCYDTPLGPKCVCRGRFVGDGYSCSPVQGIANQVFYIYIYLCNLDCKLPIEFLNFMGGRVEEKMKWLVQTLLLRYLSYLSGLSVDVNIRSK